MTLREVVYAVGLLTIFMSVGFVVGFLFQKLMDFWWRKIQRAHDLVVLSRTLKKLNKDGEIMDGKPMTRKSTQRKQERRDKYRR